MIFDNFEFLNFLSIFKVLKGGGAGWLDGRLFVQQSPSLPTESELGQATQNQCDAASPSPVFAIVGTGPAGSIVYYVHKAGLQLQLQLHLPGWLIVCMK